MSDGDGIDGKEEISILLVLVHNLLWFNGGTHHVPWIFTKESLELLGNKEGISTSSATLFLE